MKVIAAAVIAMSLVASTANAGVVKEVKKLDKCPVIHAVDHSVEASAKAIARSASTIAHAIKFILL